MFENKCKKLFYFDLITQNCFDIFSHLEFTQTFKGAVIGPSEKSILVQYKADTGSPSPGFRFLLRTRPGNKYNVTLEGKLHIGDGAFLFIESLRPNFQIVAKDKIFKFGEEQKISLNFRAVSDLTTVGMIFGSDDINYCFGIEELLVSKYDECLITGCDGCDVGDKLCQDSFRPACARKRFACEIGPPPTICDICPPAKVKCLDDFEKETGEGLFPL